MIAAVIAGVVSDTVHTGAPPDTAGWYHAAYVIAAVAYVGYIVSVWWRRRCLRSKG